MAEGDAVVTRVGLLLDAFGFDDVTLGLAELARRSGLPKPTVHRLAGQLAAEGFLERVDGRYRLGVRLFELGQRVPRHRLMRDAALPFLEDLYVTTRETVHLAVADGTEVVYLERIAGHRSATTPSRVAGRMPMYCTATGKAILAHSEPDLFRRVVASGLERRTPFTVVHEDVLARQLAEIRAEGVAYEMEETRTGYASVAAPVLAASGRPLGALSVTGPRLRVEPARLAPAVRTAARALSRALGSGMRA